MIPWTVARQASLSFTTSWSLLQLMSISTESVMPSIHLILCRPPLLLPSIFSSIRLFSNEMAPHIKWPKYWSFSFSISPPNEYLGLISFRIAWFAGLTLKALQWVPILLRLHTEVLAVACRALPCSDPIFPPPGTPAPPHCVNLASVLLLRHPRQAPASWPYSGLIPCLPGVLFHQTSFRPYANDNIFVRCSLTTPALGTAVSITVAEAAASGETHKNHVSEPARSTGVR